MVWLSRINGCEFIADRFFRKGALLIVMVMDVDRCSQSTAFSALDGTDGLVDSCGGPTCQIQSVIRDVDFPLSEALEFLPL